MAKKAATYRLEAESLEWVSSYAEERSKVDGRRVSQADVIEMGIAALRQDAAGGVPNLPPAESPVVVAKPRATPRREAPAFADANGSRQQRLNAQMLRARSK